MDKRITYNHENNVPEHIQKATYQPDATRRLKERADARTLELTEAE